MKKHLLIAIVISIVFSVCVYVKNSFDPTGVPDVIIYMSGISMVFGLVAELITGFLLIPIDLLIEMVNPEWYKTTYHNLWPMETGAIPALLYLLLIKVLRDFPKKPK